MKSKNTKTLSSYERARKRVDAIKGFYGHLAIYLIVNAIVLFTKGRFLFTVLSNEALEDAAFLNWIDWNVYGTPIIWGIFLVFHGLNVFGRNPFFGKAWEERQLKKYLKDDKEHVEKYQ